jgi:hypothetical protein
MLMLLLVVIVATLAAIWALIRECAERREEARRERAWAARGRAYEISRRPKPRTHEERLAALASAQPHAESRTPAELLDFSNDRRLLGNDRTDARHRHRSAV